MLIAGDASYA